MANKPIKRLRYFTGQFLEAEDFAAEQDYHVAMRHRNKRALYLSAGILDDGLQVTSMENASKIEISPGVAIDGEGREIVIVEPIRATPTVTSSSQRVFVVLSYDEKPTDLQAPVATVEDDISDSTRWEEKPLIGFHEKESEFDRNVAIVIARIVVKPNGEITEIDSSVRQHANGRFSGNLTIGQGGNKVLNVRHIDGKHWSNDNKDDLFINWNSGKSVHLGFGEGTKSSLYVSGNLGVGTAGPKATLDVDGNAMLGYETQLSAIGVSEFGAPIKSGFYQHGGAEIPGDVPDTSHPWTHLITARHSNTDNNHQLQIAASYAENDKLYFRKIAATGVSNPAWRELATRGTNQFVGDQTVNGNVVVGTGLTNEKHKLVIRGPNEPENESGHQDLSYEFNVAGSAKIRAYRGRSWDTYLQFLTNAAGTGTDDPKVRLHIDHNGNVGIGTTGPLNGATNAMGLHVRAGTMATLLLEQTTNDATWKPCVWQIRTGASGALVIEGITTPDRWVQINNNLKVAGDVLANTQTGSDERLKTRISPLLNVLEKLQGIRGVSFEWNELYGSPKLGNGRRQIGVIAQEVEAVFPELVTEWGDEAYKAVEYGKLTAVLIEAIKELRRENDNVRGRLEHFMKTVSNSRPLAQPD